MIKTVSASTLPLDIFKRTRTSEAGEIYVKKENESATKMVKAIATMRESGLTVTDETQKGGSIGITGVHDRREDALNWESRQSMLRRLRKCGNLQRR